MGLINRPVKGSSGTSKYAAGTDILAAEVNADLDPLYTLVNGQIDNDNIRTNAGIVGSKLNLSNFITNAHISSAADIDGAKLASKTIQTDRIADNAVSRVGITTVTTSYSFLRQATPDPGLSSYEDITDLAISGFEVPAGVGLYPALFCSMSPGEVTKGIGNSAARIWYYWRVKFDDGISTTFSLAYPLWSYVDDQRGERQHVDPRLVHPSLPAGTYTITPQWAAWGSNMGAISMNWIWNGATQTPALLTPETLRRSFIVHAIFK